MKEINKKKSSKFSDFTQIVVQVQELAIKILIDSVWVSRIPKVRKQSNLDYSVLK